MLPFDSWDGNDFGGTVEQAKLEDFFGPSAAVFNTYQAAVTSILEVLGSRSYEIPVVLPITSSPDVIAGVLRSGANPMLLDINPKTLQLDANLLREVVEAFKSIVVVLNRPAGMPVDPELLEIAADLPTIIDTRLPPHKNIKEDCVGTFTVFDFGPIVGTGSLIIHKYSEQLIELRMIRNGLLGLAANMNDALAALAHRRLKTQTGLESRKETQQTIVNNYTALLEGKKHEILFAESKEKPYLIIRVSNANRVVAHLSMVGFQVLKPVFPLHLLPIMQRRWKETPEYPVAETVANQLIALPTHPGILGREAEIVSRILEVSEGT